MTEQQKKRFRELIQQGKSMEEIARILKQESKANMDVDELFNSIFKS